MSSVATALTNLEREAEQLLYATDGIIHRINRIEKSLYSGSAEGVVISSAGLATHIHSTDWVSGTSGWIIYRDGDAEFNNVTVRGTIYASAGAFTGSVTVGSAAPYIVIDGADKSIYSSNYVIDTSGFKINGSDGNAFFNQLFINKIATIGSGATADRIYIDGTNKKVYSGSYIAGTQGWAIFGDGTAEFENIVARGRLDTIVFATNTMSAMGGQVLIADATNLSADIDDTQTTITVDNGSAFSNGDFIIIKEATGTEIMTIVSGGGTNTWTVSRATGGTARARVAGAAVIRYKDRITMNTTDPNGPFIQVIEWDGPNYSDQTLQVTIGNLAGVTDPDMSPTGYGIHTQNGYFSGEAVFGGSTGVVLNSSGASIGGGKVTLTSSGLTAGGGSIIVDNTGVKVGTGPKVTLDSSGLTAGAVVLDANGGSVNSGDVTLDTNGLRLVTQVSYPPSASKVIDWADTGGTQFARIWGWSNGVGATADAHLVLEADSDGVDYFDYADIVLRALDSSSNEAWNRIYIEYGVPGEISWGFSSYPTYTPHMTIYENSPKAVQVNTAIMLDNSDDPFGVRGHPYGTASQPVAEQFLLYASGNNGYIQTYNSYPEYLTKPQNHINYIRNYPPMEEGWTSKPQWWSTTATCTTTDPTTDSVLGSPSDVLIKGVSTGTNQRIYQRFTLADEPNFVADKTYLSAAVWLYVSSGSPTIDFFLNTNFGWITNGSVTESSASGAYKLFIPAVKIPSGATYVDFSVRVRESGKTFWIANPQLNIGSGGTSFQPRRLQYRQFEGVNMISLTDPGMSYTQYDCSSDINDPLACKLEVIGHYYNTSDASAQIRIRPGWAAYDSLPQELVRSKDTSANYQMGYNTVVLDDQQRFDYGSAGGAAGDTEAAYFSTGPGYWRWETA